MTRRLLYLTTIWTAGPMNATNAPPIQMRRAMCLTTWSVMKTWMPTGHGVLTQVMAMFGGHVNFHRVGHLTAMVIGPGLTHGAGTGLTMHPGGTLCRTTAAGHMSVGPGVGYPVHGVNKPCMPQPWLSFWVARIFRARFQ